MRGFPVLLVCLGCSLTASSLPAQETGKPLPLSGTMIYNALFHNRLPGAESRGLALRFAGRVAAAVGRRRYVGLGGGSWVRITRGDCSFADCEDLLSSQSEAIVYQLYVQQYLPRGLFLRAGAGVAETRTLIPVSFDFFEVTRRWRAAMSIGGGKDIALGSNVYLTPSLDFTVLPGADTESRELGSALAVGIGVTVR